MLKGFPGLRARLQEGGVKRVGQVGGVRRVESGGQGQEGGIRWVQ